MKIPIDKRGVRWYFIDIKSMHSAYNMMHRREAHDTA